MNLAYIGQTGTCSGTTQINLDGAAITSPDTHRTHQTAFTAGHLVDGRKYIWTVTNASGHTASVVGTYTDAATDYIASITEQSNNGTSPLVDTASVDVVLIGEYLPANQLKVVNPAVFNSYIFDAFRPKTGQTTNLTANRVYLCPYHLLADVEVTALYLRQIITAGATGVIGRMGLYDVAPDGAPGAPLFEGNGTIAMDVSGYNHSVSLSSNYQLKAGFYWIAIVSDGAPTVAGFSTNDMIVPFGMASGATTPMCALGYNITAGWSAMPDLTGVTPDRYADYGQSPMLACVVA